MIVFARVIAIVGMVLGAFLTRREFKKFNKKN